MAHFRSVDRDIWQHPAFRGASALARHVYLYLITAAADDEGRFLAAPVTVLEGMFPRTDSTTAEEIGAALRELAKSKLVLLYGGKPKCGFLLGWFEHQAEPKASFQESSLPAPRVYPACWSDCRKIKDDYCQDRSHDPQGISLANALRWFQQSQNATSTKRQRSVNATPSERQTEGSSSSTRKYKTRKRTPYPTPPTEELSTSFPQVGESESLTVTSEPETAPTGNGNGAIMQTCRNLGELFPAGPSPQDIEAYCAKQGEPGEARDQFTAQVLAEFGFGSARAP